MRSKMLLMAMYAIFDLSFSFFLSSENVYYQTIHRILSVVFFIMLLEYITVDELQWRFLKIILTWYWIGVILLYTINMVIYNNFNEWVKNFNNFNVLVIISTVSTLGAIIYSFKKLDK